MHTVLVHVVFTLNPDFCHSVISRFAGSGMAWRIFAVFFAIWPQCNSVVRTLIFSASF